VRATNKEISNESYPSMNNNNNNTRKINESNKRTNNDVTPKEDTTTSVWTKDIHCDEPSK